MFTDLFDFLTQAVSGRFGLALTASLLWGIISVILSPCHLTSIPLVIGYITRQNEASSKRAALLALSFAVGILVSIAIIGIITASMGRLMGDIGVWGNWLAAALLIIFGLYLMDIVGLTWLGVSVPQMERAGHVGAVLLGLVFGIGLGPCTFAFMAPVLTIVIPMAQDTLLKALVLVTAFGLGHSLVFVLGGSAGGLIARYMLWSESNRSPLYIKRGLGVLLLLGGIYFLLR